MLRRQSDRPARPDELRWTITKTIGQDGREFHMVDGPCVQATNVVMLDAPGAQCAKAEAERLRARVSEALDEVSSLYDISLDAILFIQAALEAPDEQ